MRSREIWIKLGRRDQLAMIGYIPSIRGSIGAEFRWREGVDSRPTNEKQEISFRVCREEIAKPAVLRLYSTARDSQWFRCRLAPRPLLRPAPIVWSCIIFCVLQRILLRILQRILPPHPPSASSTASSLRILHRILPPHPPPPPAFAHPPTYHSRLNLSSVFQIPALPRMLNFDSICYLMNLRTKKKINLQL
jgi:hypothetical protein